MDKRGEKFVAGGEMWREKRGRIANVVREPWQEDKYGEKIVAGGQMWRVNCGKRTNVEKEPW